MVPALSPGNALITSMCFKNEKNLFVKSFTVVLKIKRIFLSKLSLLKGIKISIKTHLLGDISFVGKSEAYLEPTRKSVMDVLKPLTIIAKKPHRRCLTGFS